MLKCFIMEQNWLSRRVMSVWRIAGILHALEGWNVHECGDTMFDIEEMASKSSTWFPTINDAQLIML